MSKPAPRFYEFGPFRLDTVRRLLLRGEEVVPLPPKAFDTLFVLIENTDRVLEKSELMTSIWPDSFVEESNLTQNVSILRKALGERAGEHNYIVTVPGFGYRFVATVNNIGDEQVPVADKAGEKAGPSSQISTIAVLPFKSLSTDDGQEHLGMGLADALITRLSKIRRFRVRPTSSISGFAGLAPDVISIGRKLGVDALLDGNIQRLGERIRLTVQLIRVADGVSMWAERFDEKFTDIFSVEDSISEQVATALAVKLTLDERRLLHKHSTDNTYAYVLYLKGRYEWNKRTPEGLWKSIGYFNEAIEKDPTYALAYAGLADAYNMVGLYGGLPAKEIFPRAKAAATRSLEIDDQLAEAHTSMGITHVLFDWDWESAERKFKLAIEINPSYATAYQWYALYLVWTGRPDEALTMIKRAREVNPLSLIIHADLGWILYFRGDYEEAIEECQSVLQVDRTYMPAFYFRGKALIQTGRFEESVQALQEAIKLSDHNPMGFSALGYFYARTGNPAEAGRMIDELKDLSTKRYVSPYSIATVYAGLGDNDQALECLMESYEQRSGYMAWLNVDPAFDSLRSDSRFQSLLRDVGFTVPEPSQGSIIASPSGLTKDSPVVSDIEEGAELILAKRSVTRIISEREENEPVPRGVLEKVRSRLSSRPLFLTALVVMGLIAVSYILFSRNSLRPESIREVKSIAVLPFKTLGEADGDELLGPALADALITRLSSIKRITVRPTSSVMKFTGPERDPHEAGRQLGVETVLDGLIQKSGDRVRLTVQLLRIADGKPIWGTTIEEKSASTFALQDSIAERMARELDVGLSSEERTRFAMRYTDNAEAFQAYMQGRYWWNKRGARAFTKAIEFFNKAIALDANYALAYAGLADCYALMSPYSLASRNESFPKAREAALKALQIDDRLAEAHASLAHLTWLYDWNWPLAEQEFKRAIELNPNCSTARASYSVYLSSMGRHDEAISEATRAQDLDPLSIPIQEDVTRAYYHARQYDRAILAGLKTLELDPNHYRINGWLNFAYEQKGLFDQAVEAQMKGMSVVGVRPEEIEAGRAAYAAQGWKGYWQQELELTKQRAQRTYVLPYNIARICARVGDNEQAFEWLEKAYKDHSDHLVLLKVDPIFDGMRSDARYTNLLRRVGFDQ